MLVEILHFWDKERGSVVVPFVCRRCGECCSELGAGWTYRDIEKAASYLNMDSGEFLKSYLERGKTESEKFKRVTSPCPFITSNNECSIYPYRPLACRLYPLKTFHGEGTVECPAKQRLKNFVKKLARNHPHVTNTRYFRADSSENSILSELIWNIPSDKEWNKLKKKYKNEDPTEREEDLFLSLNKKIRRKNLRNI